MRSCLLCESRGRAQHFAPADSSRLNRMPSTSASQSRSQRAVERTALLRNDVRAEPLRSRRSAGQLLVPREMWLVIVLAPRPQGQS